MTGDEARIDDPDECRVHDLTIRIDRSLCVGFGDCITEATAAFALDAENVVVFAAPQKVDRSCLLRACDACPVDAITVWDSDGRQLVPS